MSCGKYYFIIMGISLFSLTFLNAQESENLPYSIENESFETMIDTLIVSSDEKKESDKIYDIRYQLEKQNKEYTKPAPPSREMRRAMKKNNIQLSEEALYWSRNRMDPSQYVGRWVTFKDTVIPNPFFLPPVFKRKYIGRDFTITHPDKEFSPKKFSTPSIETDTTLFWREKIKKEQREKIFRHIAVHNPRYFKYRESDLPDDKIKVEIIKKSPIKDLPLKVKPEKEVVEIAAPTKFIPDRMYWTSQLESAIQFSQNYVSPNWHQGGSSNLNLYTKNYLRYDYNRNKIKFTNELEDKISIYNATKDTLHRYKIGEDVFRIHSNFGYSAFNKWYYTIDGEFKTQLFRSYEENQDKQLAGFLAPLSINIGIGMKYDLNKAFQQKGKNLQLSVNMAPLSYTYLYSRNRNIDLGRHGFQKYEDSDDYRRTLSQVGSTVRADMTMSFNPNITWQSRIYYFTTYEKVIGEFENTLILAISRHFSTRIYLHVRFDDGVTKSEDFDSYFQVNELLSFGFNYKW